MVQQVANNWCSRCVGRLWPHGPMTALPIGPMTALPHRSHHRSDHTTSFMAVQAMAFLQKEQVSRSKWRDHFATQQSDSDSHVSLEKEESRDSSDDDDAEEDDHHGPVRWPIQPTPDGSPAPSIVSSYLGSTASQSRD
jgi:hypothetical protein